MDLAERLGKTLSEVQDMSAAEFEMWKARELIRQHECPYCGVETKEFMEYDVVEVKCPVCKTKYHRMKRYGAKDGSLV